MEVQPRFYCTLDRVETHLYGRVLIRVSGDDGLYMFPPVCHGQICYVVCLIDGDTVYLGRSLP